MSSAAVGRYFSSHILLNIQRVICCCWKILFLEHSTVIGAVIGTCSNQVYDFNLMWERRRLISFLLFYTEKKMIMHLLSIILDWLRRYGMENKGMFAFNLL